MKDKLYVLVLKSGFFLGGIRAIENRYFFLKLIEDDGTYEITRGMNYNDTYSGFGKMIENPITHINIIDDFLKKGYIQLVDDPTIY